MKFLRTGSLATRITVASVLVALATVLVVGLGMGWALHKQQQRAQLALRQEHLQEHARRIQDRIEVIQDRIKVAARSTLVGNALVDSAGREAYLVPYLDRLSSIAGGRVAVLFVDFEGAPVASSHGATFTDESRRWIATAIVGNRESMHAIGDAAHPEMLYLVPVRYPRIGRAEGAIVARFALTNLLGDSRYTLLRRVDEARSSAAGAESLSLALNPPVPGLWLSQAPGAVTDSGVLDGTDSATLAISATLLLAAGLAVGVGRLAARRATRDVDLLVARIEALSHDCDAGKPLSDLPAEGAKELRVIARAVNGLARALEHSKDDMRIERELRLSGIIESSTDAIITLDAQQRVVQFNAAAAQIFGVPGEDMLGSTIERFIPLAHRAVHHQLVALYGGSAPTTGRRMGKSRQFEALRADGSAFWAEAKLTQATIDGKLFMTVIVRDVTDQRRAVEEHAARAISEAASRDKSAFMARMSHELRTPLNGILGFAELLRYDRRTPPTSEQGGRLDLIIGSGQHLLSLINDLMDISRIELGALSFDKQDIDLRVLAAAALQEMGTQAQQAEVALELNIVQDGAVWARVDPTRMRQIMINLLSNAIKYNRPGGNVRVVIEPVDQRVKLSVVDTGIGLDAQQLALLFEPFNRLGREGSVEGTGIGLVITKHLVEAMGGTLEVLSQTEIGSDFAVYLPPGTAPRPAARKVESEGPLAIRQDIEGRVLYIEDEPVNRELMKAYLQLRPKVELLMAHDGISGIETAGAQRPDLILLDMMLPDMHGLEVLSTLRSPDHNLMSPCIAFSANAMSEDMSTAKAAGVSDYLVKPIAVQLLLAAIDRHLTKARDPVPVASHAGPVTT